MNVCARVQDNIGEVGKQAKRAQMLLQRLDDENEAARSRTGPQSADDRTRTSITNSLRKKLRDILFDFTDTRSSIQVREHRSQRTQRRQCDTEARHTERKRDSAPRPGASPLAPCSTCSTFPVRGPACWAQRGNPLAQADEDGVPTVSETYELKRRGGELEINSFRPFTMPAAVRGG